MAEAATTLLHLRPGRREHLRLLPAFLLSVAVHLLVFGTYKTAQHYHWRADVLLPHWLKHDRRIEPKTLDGKPVLPGDEPPLVFIHVSPAQVVSDPPKQAKFYSDKSSLAANPEADKDTGIPKITGTQEQVPKTEDTPRKPFDRLQPALPDEPATPQEEARPKPAQAPGDLAIAKPELNPRPDIGKAERSRPRTLAEARARQENTPPGRKMKQDGGVRNIRLDPGFDVVSTPFGVYDRNFVNAVSQRWFDLLDAKRYDGYQRGKVVLQFALNYDGRITDMKVLEKSVGEDLSLICEMAVLDPAPYAPWPSDLRRLVGGNQRKVQFTFYYN